MGWNSGNWKQSRETVGRVSMIVRKEMILMELILTLIMCVIALITIVLSKHKKEIWKSIKFKKDRK